MRVSIHTSLREVERLLLRWGLQIDGCHLRDRSCQVELRDAVLEGRPVYEARASSLVIAINVALRLAEDERRIRGPRSPAWQRRRPVVFS